MKDLFQYNLRCRLHKLMAQIRSALITMLPPVPQADGVFKRYTLNTNDDVVRIIEMEVFLRRKAYRNASIKTGEAFFDDRDMQDEYQLILIYDQSTGIPLLSARIYYDIPLIRSYLLTMEAHTAYSRFSEKTSNNNPAVMIDRMSANDTLSVYRTSRSLIHALFYHTLVSHHPEIHVLAMARKEPGNKLLEKYQRLGMEVIGHRQHQGLPHWVLWADAGGPHAAAILRAGDILQKTEVYIQASRR